MSKITTFVHSVVCCQLLRSRPIIYLPKICCGPTGASKSNMEPNATGSVHSRDVYKIIIVAGCSVNMWQNDKMTAFDKMEPRFMNRMNSRFLRPAGGDAAVSRLEMIELDPFARWSQRPANCVWRVNTSAYRRLSAFKNTGTHWHPTAQHDVCCMFIFGCTAHCLCRRNVGLGSQLGLLGQLSLVSLRGRLIEYQLRLR